MKGSVRLWTLGRNGCFRDEFFSTSADGATLALACSMIVVGMCVVDMIVVGMCVGWAVIA